MYLICKANISTPYGSKRQQVSSATMLMVEASPMMEENAYTYICLRTQLNVTIAPMVELLQVTVSINLGLLID